MVRYKKNNRRTKQRGGLSGVPPASAGLMRFFEDSSMGVNVSPIVATVFAVVLIITVMVANMGVFEWLFR